MNIISNWKLCHLCGATGWKILSGRIVPCPRCHGGKVVPR